jgi:pimeloyl-ACP methyl ester carboxylesterase
VLELDDLRDVVLVGHSSGGAVVEGVAQRCPGRLRELVHLDAFVPQPGQSIFDPLPPARREHFRALVDGAGRIVLDGNAAMDGWAVTDETDRAWLGPRLRPHPVRAMSDPLPPGSRPGLPRRFVHCTVKPAGDSFTSIAATVRDDPLWRYDTLHTGHDAMITAPVELCALLVQP